MSLAYTPHFEEYQIWVFRAPKSQKGYRTNPLPVRWYHRVGICVTCSERPPQGYYIRTQLLWAHLPYILAILP